MSSSKKSGTTSGSTESSAKKGSSTSAGALVQAKIDKENAQGFRGVEVDPTPNENYTVAGVTKGAPTPETDHEAAGIARNASSGGLSPIEAAKRDKDASAANAAHTRKVKRGEN